MGSYAGKRESVQLTLLKPRIQVCGLSDMWMPARLWSWHRVMGLSPAEMRVWMLAAATRDTVWGDKAIYRQINNWKMLMSKPFSFAWES